jgi:hypothetical protein
VAAQVVASRAVLSSTELVSYMMFLHQRKHLWASTACYGDRFNFLYVDDIRASHGNTSMGFHGLLQV